MANKYIINLPEKTAINDSDIVIVEDAEDTKRMTWSNLVKPIKDTVDNLLESGSNENGTYIRFSDGTMICEGTFELTGLTCTIALDYGGYRSSGYNMSFPATFLPGTIPSVGGGFSNVNLMGKIYPGNNAGCIFAVQTINSFSTGVDVTVKYIAIGRWK